MCLNRSFAPEGSCERITGGCFCLWMGAAPLLILLHTCEYFSSKQVSQAWAVLTMSKPLKTCLVLLTRAGAVHVCDAFLSVPFRAQLRSWM